MMKSRKASKNKLKKREKLDIKSRLRFMRVIILIFRGLISFLSLISIFSLLWSSLKEYLWKRGQNLQTFQVFWKQIKAFHFVIRRFLFHLIHRVLLSSMRRERLHFVLGFKRSIPFWKKIIKSDLDFFLFYRLRTMRIFIANS